MCENPSTKVSIKIAFPFNGASQHKVMMFMASSCEELLKKVSSLFFFVKCLLLLLFKIHGLDGF